MYRTHKEIKSPFKKKKSLYRPYTQIIKSRWDRQLRKDIHDAAYYLNPVFQYDKASFCEKPKVMNGILKMLSSKGTGSKTKLVNEMRLFRERLESFGQELALETCRNTQPDEDDHIDDNEAVEVDDDIDLSSFDRFYIGDNLHDVLIGVGIGGSTSGGGKNEDDEEWLRQED